MTESLTANTSKWMSLGIMQRADQLRSVAEMLVATMEDLMEQMENVEACLEAIHGGTESLQDRMEELIFMMEDHVEPKQSSTSDTTVRGIDGNTPWF